MEKKATPKNAGKVTPMVTTPRAANAAPSSSVDILFTKIAVDLQNLSENDQENNIQDNLRAVCESTKIDAAALVLLEPGTDVIDQVTQASVKKTQCQLTTLKGQSLQRATWLSSRLAHLRLLEIENTQMAPRYMSDDAELFRDAGVGSVLLIGIRADSEVAGFLALLSVAPKTWDADLRLVLKLIGSSLASGLQRIYSARRALNENIRNQLARYSANDGLWDFNLQTDEMYFSPRWKRMLGYTDSDFGVEPPDWRSLVHPDDLAKVQSAMRDHMNGKSDVFESVHRMQHRSGSWRWVLSRAKALIDDDGRVKRLVGVELDITERRLYEDALFQEKERAQITLESIGDGVITTDSSSVIEYMNPIAELLTGWELSDATGRPLTDVFTTFHEETVQPMGDPILEAIERKRSIASHRPSILVKKDGSSEELFVDSTASPIRDGKGRICGGVLVFQDVSRSRELKRKLDHSASHDSLTGLLNRTEFESRVSDALDRVRSENVNYTVVYLDLDQFKMVNDSCGHSGGDDMLMRVADRLHTKVNWRHSLARLGGDEFAVLLEQTDLDQALSFAEKLRVAIEDYQFSWDDKKFSITASIGVIPIDVDAIDVAGVMSAVDNACAAAKESGRNRVHHFQANDIELMRRQRELQWAARINHALEEDRFEIYRQRIQPLHGPEQGDHYELLLRMRDERGGIIAPDLFLAAAERYAVMPKIDRWVISHAFRWLLSEADERARLGVCAINLSGQSLGDDKFLPFVIEQFQDLGLDPTTICFEITETAAVSSFSHANNFIR
ncbi:MAG: diguanylate cyclase, partial [Gammaproteobacteria bacterium]|nr:diguanylate cyclase [Gammaproteobacteria bacterium]